MADPGNASIQKPSLPATAAAVAACRLTRWGLRLTGHGGTALPGKAAMALARNVLARTSEGVTTIVVTGTNGKTTTCRMLEQAFTKAGKSCLANKSGANLLSGVTAEFTADATLSGKAKKQVAVIECDEGALKQVVPLVKPKVLVVTNLFSDQVDRYGDVTNTLEEIKKGVALIPETILCLNGDCSLTASLGRDVPNPVVYYGVNEPQGEQGERAHVDATHCLFCDAKMEYRFRTYAHLGGYFCPNCGYERPAPQVAAAAVQHMDTKGSDILLQMRDFPVPGAGEAVEEESVHIALSALYNVYNGLAATAAYTAAGFPAREMLSSLSTVSSSFGRMETFTVNGKRLQMILIKNTASCNQAMEYVKSVEEDVSVAILLNDRIADGTDISWIDDAGFEILTGDAHVREFYLGGDRAEALYDRLKKAGAKEEQLWLSHDMDALVEKLTQSPYPVMALPNYTTMLDLRAKLAALTGKDAYWK